MALELSRLEAMETVFLKDAIENLNYQSGTLAVKISTRKAALMGLDQPQTVKLDVTQVVEQDTKTSTQRMLEAIQALRDSDPHKAERDAFEEQLREKDRAAAQAQTDALQARLGVRKDSPTSD